MKLIKILSITSSSYQLANYININEPIGILTWAYWTFWGTCTAQKSSSRIHSLFSPSLCSERRGGKKQQVRHRSTYTDYNGKHITERYSAKVCKNQNELNSSYTARISSNHTTTVWCVYLYFLSISVIWRYVPWLIT